MTKRETALKLLIEERDGLNHAILTLQTLVTGERRRGRKPKGATVAHNVVNNTTTTPTNLAPVAKAKKRHMSPAARKRQAAIMKARWAKVKAAGATNLKVKTARAKTRGAAG